MTIVALMYHDVTPPGREDASGFAGGDAARYKLTPDQFRAHLDALASRACAEPATVEQLDLRPTGNGSHGNRLILTFDDGGASAATEVANALEARGWRGHFFVTTSYLDQAGFLGRRHVRDLRRRGHVIGSHSHSHPLRMSSCSPARLADEWRRSVAALTELLGEPIVTASVPGGASSRLVERTAAEAGIRVLFTSEPTRRMRRIDGTLVLGRYAMLARTSPESAAAIAAGRLGPRLQSIAEWEIKRAFKILAGPWYLRGRRRLLRGSDRVRWGDEGPAASKDPS